MFQQYKTCQKALAHACQPALLDIFRHFESAKKVFKIRVLFRSRDLKCADLLAASSPIVFLCQCPDQTGFPVPIRSTWAVLEEAISRNREDCQLCC
jgi:hypothetical protein